MIFSPDYKKKFKSKFSNLIGVTPKSPLPPKTKIVPSKTAKSVLKALTGKSAATRAPVDREPGPSTSAPAPTRTTEGPDPFTDFFRDIMPTQSAPGQVIFEDNEYVVFETGSIRPDTLDIPLPPAPAPLAPLHPITSQLLGNMTQVQSEALDVSMTQFGGFDEPDNDPWLSSRNPPPNTQN